MSRYSPEQSNASDAPDAPSMGVEISLSQDISPMLSARKTIGLESSPSYCVSERISNEDPHPVNDRTQPWLQYPELMTWNKTENSQSQVFTESSTERPLVNDTPVSADLQSNISVLPLEVTTDEEQHPHCVSITPRSSPSQTKSSPQLPRSPPPLHPPATTQYSQPDAMENTTRLPSPLHLVPEPRTTRSASPRKADTYPPPPPPRRPLPRPPQEMSLQLLPQDAVSSESVQDMQVSTVPMHRQEYKQLANQFQTFPPPPQRPPRARDRVSTSRTRHPTVTRVNNGATIEIVSHSLPLPSTEVRAYSDQGPRSNVISSAKSTRSYSAT
eukprot:gb/GEZN01008070.1/.p1 GENE.gb/GEZN01008070.1/~~gb/GEZN01008070.1/.p1  ORF type:complete len:328 (-),score=12.82 gb/GEZN01008070.1/:46-1029(-)